MQEFKKFDMPQFQEPTLRTDIKAFKPPAVDETLAELHRLMSADEDQDEKKKKEKKKKQDQDQERKKKGRMEICCCGARGCRIGPMEDREVDV